MRNPELYKKQIERASQLKKAGIRTGQRQFFWVDQGYGREYYLTAKGARDRANELLNQPPISKKRLCEIARIADEDIDTSDIPETSEDFFKRAKFTNKHPR